MEKERATRVRLSFTEASIRQRASGESFRRGKDYYRAGSVGPLRRRGNIIDGEVEGSQFSPYHVHFSIDIHGVASAACSCPYDWGGWCKHIVAALLKCAHEPEKIDERPTLEDLLSGLDGGQLHAVLLRLVKRGALSADSIEREISLLQANPVQPDSQHVPDSGPGRTLVDQKALRRRVYSILQSLDRMRPSEAYWRVGEVVDEVNQVVEEAWWFIVAGDGHSALDILEAVTEEYMDGWEMLDDSDGEASGFFYEVGYVWTEAILTANLTPDELQGWGSRLKKWQKALDDYGVYRAFAAANAAAEQGWDYGPLQRILKGEALNKGVATDDDVYSVEGLITARLNVLERQGREQEYFYLAKAGGHIQPYVGMLVRLGRIPEAIEHGLQNFRTADEALSLARVLNDQNALGEALRVAGRGLALAGPKAPLAIWLRDAARDAGDLKLAVEAAVVAVRSEPELDSYLIAKDVAGEYWPKYRAELLDHLRRSEPIFFEGPVEIFLHEGQIAGAIALVDRYGDDTLVAIVAEAALESHPDWVIQTCRQRAERIMNRGKSERYYDAVKWLFKAGQAYRGASRDNEWRSYLKDLVIRHRRKHKLMPMLKELDGH